MSMISKIALILCMVSTTLYADVVARYKDATGVGTTHGEAVALALENAVGKAFGFRLEGELHRTLSERSRYIADENEEEVIAEMSREVTRRVSTSSNTPVTGYDILSVSENSSGGWEANVRIHYKDYESLGAENNRRTLVVKALDHRSSAFTEAVEAALIASRRFNVLKRDEAAAFNDEEAFIMNGAAGRNEIARLGRSEGADYIVLVKTENYFSRLNQERFIEATNERLYKSEGGFTFDVEVVEFSSRETKWRKRDNVYVVGERKVSSAESLMSGVTESYAANLVLSLVSTIYPARIAQVMGNKAVLNRGEGSISIGQSVDIYLIGDKLVDPQGGESLGVMEVKVAQAKVVELKPKFSVLQLTSGVLKNGTDYIVRWSPREGSPARINRKAVESVNRQVRAKEEVKALDDAFMN